MARISIKPIEPLEMEFANGTVKEALFNNEAFIIFTEEFGNIDELIKTELKDKPYDFSARLLYAGMRVIDKTVTLEEARSIIVGGGEALLQEMTSLIIDNFMTTADEESKKKFLTEVKKINKSLK